MKNCKPVPPNSEQGTSVRQKIFLPCFLRFLLPRCKVQFCQPHEKCFKVDLTNILVIFILFVQIHWFLNEKSLPGTRGVRKLRVAQHKPLTDDPTSWDLTCFDSEIGHSLPYYLATTERNAPQEASTHRPR